MSDHKSGASGSEKRQRLHIIAVRVNGAERTELAARADRVGLSVPAYIRHQALDVAPPRQRPRPTAEIGMLARLLGQISQMGGDVNVMTRRLDETGWVSGRELRALELLHTGLSRWGEELLRAMGREARDDN